ncbi:amidase [Paludibaculum fermentans]|uniref:Asp-tRNA(Asn)/Glu-tRNA(Gln) amidotransferase GatCAB subunit A n=1 Tax=Paludibaculum fermentans TaxID=1473598 RepID=A0A7S7SME2_PALFE|nr:amidase [Paludibaculum fermentans]QOY91177.1 Asp-tRNA(Asn)/Glu-tRNA(Gln) amidotransferase GatCAB subunit A [Paludibaculum fermentans]
MTALEAAAALRARKISSVELTVQCLAQIEKLNPTLNAFITVTANTALAEARKADEELAQGMDRGPLHGIPIAHKDLLCTNGVRTTSGSKVFSSYIPNFDAAVVERWREAGAVMLGKTGLHEHAYGITSTNPHFGAIRNPWNPECIPGGSSGGSAVAVATGMALLATGSDTGGSIRVPASYCGIAGIKATFGRVSKFGALPLGFTLDHMGPLGRTVRDVAVALQAMAGYDKRDSTTVDRPVPDYLPPVGEISLKGVKIGMPLNFFYEKLDPQVDNAVHFMAYTAQDLGAELVDVRVPDGRQLNTVAQVTLLAEAASVHEPYIRKQRASYGEDVRTLIDMGRVLPATDYLQAQRLRKRMLGVYQNILKSVDCLLVPSTAIFAPKIGQTEIEIAGAMEDTRLASTKLVRGFNALGLPVVALPAGFSNAGLPVGCQLVGRAWGEQSLLRIAAALEDRAPHYKRTWQG